ncbi:MAG: hypothetical protein AAF108_09875 [Planctomycetota bacterium]
MAKKTTTKKSTKKTAKKRRVKKGDAAVPPDQLLAPPPIPLTEIVGHAKPVSILARAVASGRLHHAWIFHGPRGVGKRTTALAFAAALLDPTTEPDPAGLPRPDPASPVAGLLAAGAHPDLHLITKELARYSDDKRIRDAKLASIPKDVIDTRLIQRIPLAPSVTVHGVASRVFIVDEAELLDRSPTNAPVQNALLKTLEEPPPGAVLILVTESEDRLLPTIRSRCQRVAFTPLSAQELDAWAERPGSLPERWQTLEPGGRSFLLSFASGSPGLLLEAVSAELDRWHRTIEPMLDRTLEGQVPATFGKSLTDLVNTWAETRASADKNRSKAAATARGAELAVRVIAASISGRLRHAVARGDRADAEHLAASLNAINTARERQGSAVALAFVMEGLVADLASRQATAG